MSSEYILVSQPYAMIQCSDMRQLFKGHIDFFIDPFYRFPVPWHNDHVARLPTQHFTVPRTNKVKIVLLLTSWRQPTQSSQLKSAVIREYHSRSKLEFPQIFFRVVSDFV